MTAMLMISDKRPTNSIASSRSQGYCSPVAHMAISGPENPRKSRRHSAKVLSTASAFFMLAVSFYGGCVRGIFGCAGFLDSLFLSPRTAATYSPENDRGSSSNQGAVPMKHALIPSAIRAFAHRRMALSALRANSTSLATRLKRYSHHMTIARSLESVGGAQ